MGAAVGRSSPTRFPGYCRILFIEDAVVVKHGAAVGIRPDETVEDCFPFDQGVVLCRCFD